MTTLAEIEEVIGPALLARLIAVFAGTVVTVTKRPGGPMFVQVERVIGTEAAERLGRRFAGAQVYIPLNTSAERDRRNVEIAARIASGESPRTIARSYRNPTISVQHVYRIAKRMKP